MLAWQEFRSGKRGKDDVRQFERHLMDNLICLHRELNDGTYRHSGYHHFSIVDPKPRSIHKATVRDRVVNHAIYRLLYPFFDRTFIHDSYSCRRDKGTSGARDRFKVFARRVSRNDTVTCWVLKCDIRQFFASIDHRILIDILARYLPNAGAMALLTTVIESFETRPGKGLPLGNLTSQLLVNVYMNEFDQFVKHELKARYYLRYADDFVLMARDRGWLIAQLPHMKRFLEERLELELHPDKISLETLNSGVDFLGWIHFPHHSVLRTKTKQRMLKRVAHSDSDQTVQSYLGLLSQGNAYKLSQEVGNRAWLGGEE